MLRNELSVALQWDFGRNRVDESIQKTERIGGALGINAFWYHWLWAWEDGGVGVSASATIRFDPQYGLAQTALSFADGGGYTGIGITGFETRPKPQGPNQPTDFSYDPNFGFPPVVNADLMTTVSAQLFVGGGQAATALLTVFLFD